MATWLEPAAMTPLLSYISTNSTHMYLVKNFATTDDWTTITGNIICKIATVPADFTTPALSGSNMEMTWNGGTGTATADGTGAPTDNYHGLLVDEAETTVIVATNETTNNPITSGNEVVFGSFAMRVMQPIQATGTGQRMPAPDFPTPPARVSTDPIKVTVG